MAYVVHEFQSGEVLMAGQLNEMDAQIASNESAASDRSYIAAAYSVAPYSKGSLVVYGGEIWEAVVDITVAEAWNSVHWKRATLNDRLKEQDQMVVVQDATPSSYVTKVWLPATPPSGIQVPTYSEFEDMDDEITDLKTANNQLIDPVTGAFNAGIARKIISDQYATDKAPYTFRKGFDADFLEDKITGGTVVWNQLINKTNIPNTTTISGVTFTNNGDGSVTLTGEASAAIQNQWFVVGTGTLNENHKYYIQGCPDGGGVSTFYVGDGYTLKDKGNGYIGTLKQLRCYIVVTSGANFTTPKTFRLQIIDLTVMFGSTIADYIYGLEQATAGAGVAWFRNLFPNSYYAYDAGSLQSVQTSARKVVGFNQWDEEWESYGSAQIKSKNRIRVIPGATYYAKCESNGLSLYYFATSDSATNGSKFVNNNIFTIPSNANYMVLYTASGYGATYKNDICINLSDSSMNGTYKPYESKTYPLDSDLVLRGIPKLDSNNNLYYDGDSYEADGTVTRRYSVVDLGTLTWTKNNTGTEHERWSTIVSSPAKFVDHSTPVNLICSMFVKATYPQIYNHTVDHSIGFYDGTTILLWSSNYTTYSAEDFKTAMSGVKLVYELATPTTEEADPYSAGQLCFPDGTEEYIDAGVTATTPTRDVSIPVGGDRRYYKDFRREVREMIAELQALVLEN